MPIGDLVERGEEPIEHPNDLARVEASTHGCEVDDVREQDACGIEVIRDGMRLGLEAARDLVREDVREEGLDP